MAHKLTDNQQHLEPAGGTVEPTSPQASAKGSILGLRAIRAFHRDLGQLLQEQPGEWVAYHGDERVGFGRTGRELYQECLRRGLHWDDFFVGCIEPELPGLILDPLPD